MDEARDLVEEVRGGGERLHGDASADTPAGVAQAVEEAGASADGGRVLADRVPIAVSQPEEVSGGDVVLLDGVERVEEVFGVTLLIVTDPDGDTSEEQRVELLVAFRETWQGDVQEQRVLCAPAEVEVTPLGAVSVGEGAPVIVIRWVDPCAALLEALEGVVPPISRMRSRSFRAASKPSRASASRIAWCSLVKGAIPRSVRALLPRAIPNFRSTASARL